MERFFRYSKDHAKPIRLLTIASSKEGKMAYLTVIAVQWDEKTLWYIRNSSRPQKPRALERDRILAAEYARGDDGDTLKYIGQKEEEENDCKPAH